MKSKIRKWIDDILFYCRSPEIVFREEAEKIRSEIEEVEAEWQKKVAFLDAVNFTRICAECHWYRKPTLYPVPVKDSCKCSKAPVTNFVSGDKNPAEINRSGKCEYWKPRVSGRETKHE